MKKSDTLLVSFFIGLILTGFAGLVASHIDIPVRYKPSTPPIIALVIICGINIFGIIAFTILTYMILTTTED